MMLLRTVYTQKREGGAEMAKKKRLKRHLVSGNQLRLERRKEIGKFLKDSRNKAGLTLMEASVELGYQSTGTLHNVEMGLTPLPIEKIHPISEDYDLDLRELLGKIAECEPNLYNKYVVLRDDIVYSFVQDAMYYSKHDGQIEMIGQDEEISAIAITSMGKRGNRAEIAEHHAPFPLINKIFGFDSPVSDNAGNVNLPGILYIMSTILSETATHQKNPPRITKTAHLLQITPQTTKGPGNPPFAQGAPYYVEYRGNEGLLN